MTSLLEEQTTLSSTGVIIRITLAFNEKPRPTLTLLSKLLRRASKLSKAVNTHSITIKLGQRLQDLRTDKEKVYTWQNSFTCKDSGMRHAYAKHNCRLLSRKRRGMLFQSVIAYGDDSLGEDALAGSIWSFALVWHRFFAFAIGILYSPVPFMQLLPQN